MTRAPIGEFTNELRTLKQRSSHTYQALADTLDRPVSTIHGWITGRHLPYARDNSDFEQLLTLLGVVEPDRWMTRLSRLRLIDNSPAVENPYRGLESFTEDDASIFHGRGDLTGHLVELATAAISHGASHPVMVIGASGSGKTSVLRAGLASRLVSHEGVTVGYTTPGDDPIGALSAAIPTRSDPTGSLGRVFIIDQFEELFSPHNSAAVDPFIDLLSKIHHEPGLALVIGMRADFFHRAADIPFLLGGLQHNQTLVGPIDTDAIADCIVGPARLAGLSIDADLLAELLSAFTLHAGSSRHTSVLPLLSHVLYLLAENHTGNRLTLDCYRAIGGLETALRRTADALLDRFDEGDTMACRLLFVRMVELGHDSLPTRRTANLASVRAAAGDLDIDTVIGAFAQQRLLTTDVETVTISHEALLSAWPKLAEWIHEERDSLAEYRRVGDSARTWDHSGRNIDLLWRGEMLAKAADLLDDPSLAQRFGPLETEFVTQGLAAAKVRRAGQDRAMSRQLAIQATSMRSTDVSLSSQLAIVADTASSTIESRSALFASTSPLPGARFLGGPGHTALGMARGGSQVAYSNAVDNSITVLDNIAGVYQRVRELQLPDDGGQTLSVSLSLHGRWLASGDSNGGVTITDLLTTRSHKYGSPGDNSLPGPVNAVLVDSARTRLFAACGAEDRHDADEGGLWWWDTTADGRHESGGSIRSIGEVMALSTSIDRNLLAGSTRLGHVHLWDLDDPTEAIWSDTSATGDPASAVSISPDGRLMAAGYHSGRVRVWRLTQSADVSPVEAAVDAGTFASWVNWVEFSPDSSMLTAASSDGNVRFWETTDLKDLRIDLRHPTVVICAKFANAGTVITTAEDGTARVWNLPTSVSMSKNSAIWSVSTSADGDLIATASRNRAVIWRVGNSGELQVDQQFTPDNNAPFSGASLLSPDGGLLAVATRTGPVLIHDLARPDIEPRILSGLSGLVENLAVSNDGRLICGVDSGGHLQVWSIDRCGRPTNAGSAVLGSPAMMPAFDASGENIAIALESGEVAMLTVEHSGNISFTDRWKVGSSFCLGVSFHPVLSLLAAANADRSVSIWDTQGAGPPRLVTRLTGPGGKIMSVAFGPGGALLAAGVTDGKAWIWDTSDPAHPSLVAAIQSPEQGIYALAFSPDGCRLHAAGPHHRLFSWLIDSAAAANAVRAAVGDEITPEEWTHLIPSMPYTGIGLAHR